MPAHPLPLRPSTCTRRLLVLLSAGLSAVPAHAATYYLDVNGATAGSGVIGSGTYNWNQGGETNWSTVNTGTAATAAGNWGGGQSNEAVLVATGDAGTNAFTLTLPGGGVQTWVGPVTVNSGNPTISVSTGNFVIGAATAWSVAAGSTLTVTGSGGSWNALNVNGNSMSFGGNGNYIINGMGNSSGTVTKNGTGSLTLTAGTNYSGATTINGGSMVFQSTYSTPSFALNGGVVDFNVTTGTRDLASATFTGTGTLRKTGAGQVLWGGTSANFQLAVGGTIDVQGGTFIGGSSANEVWTSNQGNLNVASGALFNGVEANVRVGALSGLGTIRSGYSGAGYSTFTFGVGDVSGSYGGTLSHNEGTAYGHYTKIGTGTQTFTGTIRTIANGGGTGITISGGTVELGGSGTFDGGTWTNGLVNNGAFHYSTTANNTMAGVISGSGILNKSGTGTLTLSGGNNFSGVTTINAGTLKAGNASALGNTTGATNVNGGVLDVNGFNLGAEQINLGGGKLANSGSDQINAVQRVTVTADSTFGGSTRWDLRNGLGLTVNSGAKVTKVDGNTVAVVNSPIANNGTIQIDSGLLALHLNVASTGTGTYAVKSGGELEISSHGTPVTVANGVTVEGGKLSSQEASGGASSFSGPITLGAAAESTFQANANFNVTGAIGGNGSLAKTGAGTLTVSSGANTYTGKTLVRQGTLAITGGGGGLGNPDAATDAITLGSAGQSGTLALTGGSLTLASARGLALAGNGGTLNVGTGLTVSLNAGVSGNVVGSTFTKAGAGTFNLTGNSDINALVVSDGEYNQLAGVTQVISTTTGLSIQNGATYRLSGGTLKADKITTAGTGKFTWGAGTLTTRSTNGNLGTTDYSGAGYQSVQSGLTATIGASVATDTGSVWAMHGSPTLYLNSGVRFNNWAITGDLDLTAGGDTLEFELNPYLLRPFSSAGIGAIETGSLPLITWTGAFAPGGAFNSVTGILSSGVGFTESPTPVSDPTLLATDTWHIEYDAAAQTIWFHYKVSGYVPEPGSFGLFAIGAFTLRTLRALRRRARHTAETC
jgi:autotransporter-associated beta strand protein